MFIDCKWVDTPGGSGHLTYYICTDYGG